MTDSELQDRYWFAFFDALAESWCATVWTPMMTPKSCKLEGLRAEMLNRRLTT